MATNPLREKVLLNIGLTIINNTNTSQQVNLFGNPSLTDTSNAKTEYRWNFTSFVFTGENAVSIEYKLNGAAAFSNFTYDLPAQSLDGVVAALDNLGIGYFSTYTELGQTYVGTYNDNYTFGDLSIGTSAFLITEGFDFIMTEAGDFIITE